LNPVACEHRRIDSPAVITHAQAELLGVVPDLDLHPPGMRGPEGFPQGFRGNLVCGSSGTSALRSPVWTDTRPRASGGSLDGVRPNTVTSWPAASAWRSTWRPRDPLAPRMRRRDITTPRGRTRPPFP